MNTNPNATSIVVIFSLYQILFWEASVSEVCQYNWSDFLTQYFEEEINYVFDQEDTIRAILEQQKTLESLAQSYLTKPFSQSLPLFQAFVLFLLFDLKDEAKIPNLLKLAKELLGASTTKTIHTIAKKHCNKALGKIEADIEADNEISNLNKNLDEISS